MMKMTLNLLFNILFGLKKTFGIVLENLALRQAGRYETVCQTTSAWVFLPNPQKRCITVSCIRAAAFPWKTYGHPLK